MPNTYDLLIVSHDNMGTLVPLGDPDAKDWMKHLAKKWANAKYFQLQPKAGVKMPIVRVNVPDRLVTPVYYIRTQKKFNAKTGDILATRVFYNVGWVDGDVAILTSVGPFGNICTEQMTREDLPEQYHVEKQEV